MILIQFDLVLQLIGFPTYTHWKVHFETWDEKYDEEVKLLILVVVFLDPVVAIVCFLSVWFVACGWVISTGDEILSYPVMPPREFFRKTGLWFLPFIK